MKYIVKRDKVRRRVYNKGEVRGLFGKAVLRSGFYCVVTREQVRNDRVKLRVKGRCIFTGRGKGINNFFGISRMKLLEMGRGGEIVGCRKSSW